MATPKVVHVPDVGVVSFPSEMPDHRIVSAIKAHRDKQVQASVPPSPSTVIVRSDTSVLPPELQRIQQAVGAQLVQGKPYGDAIATVGEHEPHKIEINDPARFAQGKNQTTAHELIHLLLNQLSGPVNKAIPPDNPRAPYDISDVDQLRAKGLKLWQLPQEKAAALVQTYTADPSQRKRLQIWIDDLNSAPLSLVQPTSPDAKTLNIKPRVISPPIEGYLPYVKEQANKLRGAQ